jgi:acyl-CoA thioesterase I
MTGWLMLVLFRQLRQRHSSPCPAHPTRRVGLCVAVLLAVSAVPAALASAQATILVLGDSISAGYGIQRERGWVSQLSNRLDVEGRGWEVVNASTSGETTGGGLARLPTALNEHDPDVVIIELGGNDGLRGYPVASIRDNLSRMVGLARDAGSEVLLVGMQIPPNYGPRYTRTFAAVFEEVAEQHDVPLVPFLLEQVALRPELMQQDGIHPTADAQQILLDTLWPHLTPLLDG